MTAMLCICEHPFTGERADCLVCHPQPVEPKKPPITEWEPPGGYIRSPRFPRKKRRT